MINYNKGRKIVKYIHNLALLDALLVFYKFGKNEYTLVNPVIELILQKIEHPIYLRKGTSDLAIFREVFIEK